MNKRSESQQTAMEAQVTPAPYRIPKILRERVRALADEGLNTHAIAATMNLPLQLVVLIARGGSCK